MEAFIFKQDQLPAVGHCQAIHLRVHSRVVHPEQYNPHLTLHHSIPGLV